MGRVVRTPRRSHPRDPGDPAATPACAAAGWQQPARLRRCQQLLGGDEGQRLDLGSLFPLTHELAVLFQNEGLRLRSTPALTAGRPKSTPERTSRNNNRKVQNAHFLACVPSPTRGDRREAFFLVVGLELRPHGRMQMGLFFLNKS